MSAVEWHAVCCAVSFGYGPVAKGVAIAGRARRLGITIAFLGTGVALELAHRSDAFCECIAAEPTRPAGRRAMRAAGGVLCVMDPDAARCASDLGRELTVVDSLFWMWDKVPHEYLAADAYFVQDFPGVRERAVVLDRPPTVVGAIVLEHARATAPSGRLVVNLGGFESPFDEPGADPYGELVISALLASALGESYRGRTLVIGGSSCLTALGDQLRAAGVAGRSLSPEAARDEVARADLLLTSPGLTTTLAAFGASVPTLFLPPQNYSQWLILTTMRELGLAPCALHWQDCDPEIPVGSGMPEAVAVPEVKRAISRLARSEPVCDALRERLDGVLSIDRGALASRQNDWCRSLGRNGAETVAQHLRSSLARKA